jgi:hypothetical protein
MMAVGLCVTFSDASRRARSLSSQYDAAPPHPPEVDADASREQVHSFGAMLPTIHRRNQSIY